MAKKKKRKRRVVVGIRTAELREFLGKLDNAKDEIETIRLTCYHDYMEPKDAWEETKAIVLPIIKEAKTYVKARRSIHPDLYREFLERYKEFVVVAKNALNKIPKYATRKRIRIRDYYVRGDWLK